MKESEILFNMYNDKIREGLEKWEDFMEIHVFCLEAHYLYRKYNAQLDKETEEQKED